MPQPSAFARKLADVAFAQHNRFHMTNEADPFLCRQIRKYWDDLGLGFTSCTRVPWSAVFVSWCVKSAGATSLEFKFSAAHSMFVHRAIRNANAMTGVFRGVDVSAAEPAVGDIIQNNRNGATFDFAFAAANTQYASHSAIVVEIGQDSAGRFALTIGGNEADSIRRTVVRLRADGRIKQRQSNPFICLIRNLK
jgi:hypothetical protein